MKTLGYLVIPQCQIEHANAEANQYIIGLPAITSFTGFAHQQIRLLAQRTQLELHENGTAIIVHDFHLRDGHPRCPAYMKEEEAGKPASIVEEIKADMRVSLLIRIAINADEDREEMREQLLDNCFTERRIKETLQYHAVPALQHQHHFLSGGHTTTVGTIRFIHNETDLKTWLKTECRKGYLIQDRYDLLANSDKPPLETLLNSMTTVRVDEKSPYHRQQKGWILPVAVGYQAIETPQARIQARGNYPHVYAEPLTSLAEAVSVKRLANNQKNLTQQPIFWTHQHQAENGLYYVTAIGA